MADHLLRAAAEPDRPDRRQLRRHRPLRDPDLGGARVPRHHQPQRLELRRILYWAQSGSAVQLGAWWWYVFPGMAVAILGMSLVLINFGLDELGNPRLRALAQSAPARARRNWRPADPTPVHPRLRRARCEHGERPRPHATQPTERRPPAPVQQTGAGHPRSVDHLPRRRRRRPRRAPRRPGAAPAARSSAWRARAAAASRRSRYGAVRLLRPPAIITGGSVIYNGRRLSAGTRRIRRAGGRATPSCAAALARDRDRLPERDERAEPGAPGRGSDQRRHPRAPAGSPRAGARSRASS